MKLLILPSTLALGLGLFVALSQSARAQVAQIDQNGVLYTPKEQYVLAGVSRETVIELAEQLKLKLVEDDLTPYNAYTVTFVGPSGVVTCSQASCTSDLVP